MVYCAEVLVKKIIIFLSYFLCYDFEFRTWRGVLDTTLCDKVWQLFAASRWFPPGTTIYSTKNTDVHDITKLLLKVALDTIIITRTLLYYLARYTNKHKIQHIYIELMQRNVLLINVIIYLLKICLILHMW